MPCLESEAKYEFANLDAIFRHEYRVSFAHGGMTGKEMGIAQDREYYVYILCNQKNGALYSGMTNDLSARVREHKNKTNPKSYTAQKNIARLVYFEIFDTPGEAIDREKLIALN